MKTKIFSTMKRLLVAAVVLSGLSVVTYAQGNVFTSGQTHTDANGVTWTYDVEGTYDDYGCLGEPYRVFLRGMSGYTDEVIVPEALPYDGKDWPVTGFGGGWLEDENPFCHKEITKVTLPSTITSIPQYAFYECKNLREVNIPEGVSYIGDCSFQNCYNLRSIIIPANVQYIYGSTFWNCNNLETMTIAKDSKLQSINGFAFTFCNSLKSIDLTNASLLTTIGAYAFSSTTGDWESWDGSLTEVKLPSSIRDIGERAFANQRNLTSINLPEGLNSIGTSCFRWCRALKSITIPSTLTSLPEYLFTDCSALESVTLPSTLTELGSYAFQGCTSLSQITLPEGLVNIPVSVFQGCSALTSIVLPSTVTALGTSSFENCTSLASVKLSASLTYIPNRAFYGCSALTDITLPTVANIGAYAFDGCKGLAQISLPTSLKAIGDYAFNNCSRLTAITIPAAVSAIGGASFSNCTGLTSISGDANNANYASVDNILYDKAITTLILCPAFKESVTIPNTVTTIGNKSFAYNTKIKAIVIPEGVTDIGSFAFYECRNLIEVTLPGSLSSIGANAFSVSNTNPEPGEDEYAISNLGIVFITSSTPATSYTLRDINYDATVVVPTSALEAYRTHSNWSQYASQIVCSVDDIRKTVTMTAKLEEPALVTAIGMNNLEYVVDLKINGSLNGYDIMIMRNKMPRLRYLDLSEAKLVGNDYQYYTGSSMNDNEIGNDSFRELNLVRVVLPESVTCIGDRAFYGCTRLSEINIHDNIGEIGGFAFYYCKSLSDLHIKGNGNTSIGSYAFAGCRSIKEVWLGNGIAYLGDKAFEGTSIENLTIIGNGKAIINGWLIDGNDSLRDVIIGNGVISIGSSTFRACSSLKRVLIGDKVETISEYAFTNCFALTDLTLGKGLKTIGGHLEDRSEYDWNSGKYVTETVFVGEGYSFSDCTSLRTIIFPGKLTNIGRGCFASCSSLTEIKLPDEIKQFGENAFVGCPLKKVYAYSPEPRSIGQNTFSCWDEATLYVPTFSFMKYYLNTQWSQFRHLEEFDATIESFTLESDYRLDDDTGRIQGEENKDPDMTMENTSGFIIEGKEVQLLDKIELNHDGTDGGSIITEDDNLQAKSMKVKIGVESGRWYFLCFPFPVSRDSISCTGDYALYTYNGAQRATGATGWQQIPSSQQTLEEGVGYIFQSSRNGILSIGVGKEYLTFKANNKSEKLISYGSDDMENASWNFVGNPFISYYDLDDLAKDYDSPIVIWNGNSYDAYRPGDDEGYQLHPFQAFFVQKPTGKTEVEFRADNRITQIEAKALNFARAQRHRQYGYEVKADRQLVNLILMDKDSTMERTRVVFNEKASLDYEIGTDASKFLSSGVMQLYTIGKDKVKYAINERPTAEGEVAIGYSAPTSGTYTFSTPRMDTEVVLVDHELNQEVMLSEGDYTFTSAAGTFNNRFTLRRTGGTSVEGASVLGGMLVKAVDGGIELKNVEAEVIIYSASGAEVATTASDGIVPLASGNYIVKAANRNTKICVL